jgi:hypothetical protein
LKIETLKSFDVILPVKFSYKKLIICLVILACAGAIYYGIYTFFPNKRYEKAFAQINIGDSKEKAADVFGKSGKIENCHYIIYSEVKQETKDKCVEIHWYIGFLEEWGFGFDNEGKVIQRLYSISG